MAGNYLTLLIGWLISTRIYQPSISPRFREADFFYAKRNPLGHYEF